MTQPHHGYNRELARFFSHRQDCTTLRQDAHKLLLRAHNQGPQQQDYFIKIYQYPHFFHSRIKNRKFVGGGREYRVCIELKKRGIPTPVPVGFATDRTWMGVVKRSLYASRWLEDAQTLDAVIRHQHQHGHMDKQSWRHFIHDLGTFLGQIHLLLVNAQDLNTKNILVQKWPQTKPRFILVDYERIVFLKKYDLAKFINALAQVGASLLPDFESDIRRLCEGYTRHVPHMDAKELRQKLIAASWQKNRQWQREIDDLFTTIDERLQGNEQAGRP